MSVIISICLLALTFIFLLHQQKQQPQTAIQRQRAKLMEQQRQAKQQRHRQSQGRSRRGGEAQRNLAAQRRQQRLAQQKSFRSRHPRQSLLLDQQWDKLHGLTHCRSTSERLVSSIMKAHAGRSAAWALDKAIAGIQRDRRS